MINGSWPGVVAAYRDYLPLNQDIRVITLLEGATPLYKAEKIAKEIAPAAGLNLFLKFEGLNPTGSFKDRGMTVALSHALSEGAETVICASTGNTAASAAAYAAKAGVRCLVLVPKGNIAHGKLAATLAHGAEVVSISGSFDDGLELVRQISKKRPIALVNSVNPWRIEGQKTGAFEICDQLGGSAPDWHCLPVGNAGNIFAYWKGYRQYKKGLPRLLGAQAAGSAPIVLGRVVKNPDTAATAIRIGNPARWADAARSVEQSNGLIAAVTDSQIMESWGMLAQMEGLFVEPASAAGLAALIQEIKKESIDPAGKNIVIVLTGHGLKDPAAAITQAADPVELAPSLEALEAYLDS